MQVALTIAGSDSGGGAGIQADLKTFAAHGVFGTSVITAITAQNTCGVSGVLEVSPEMIGAQFDAVCSDFEMRAAKIGMLGSRAIIEIVAEKIAQWKIEKLVVDPVMIAKSGDALLREDAVQSLIEKILPLAHIVTPNLPEAEVLCGERISDDASRNHAARLIWEKGAHGGREFYVIIKGGHAENSATSIDVLFDGESFQEYSAPRIDSKNTHGTGCTFSAAICAQLARGRSTPDAVAAAKKYISAAIAQAPKLGSGHGPLQHFPQL
jgi:hydroxymethylpyrimidine/phosphomethylpyrimidine kinase